MRGILTLFGLLALPAATACSGTGHGGTGDAPAEPNADKLGAGARLSDLLGPATWLDPTDNQSTSCDIPADRQVHVTGLTIAAIDRFDETNDGQSAGNYYVVDTSLEPKPYSGVLVYSPTFSPPDLRLAEGDVVDALGVLMEFLGPSTFPFEGCQSLPELSGTLSFRFDSGTRVPADITLEDLKGYEAGRRYLGMLVRVKDVEISGEPDIDGAGRLTANFNVGAGVPLSEVPKLSNELYDVLGEGPPLTDGTQLESVTGVVTFFHGFKIAPRSPEDVVLKK